MTGTRGSIDRIATAIRIVLFASVASAAPCVAAGRTAPPSTTIFRDRFEAPPRAPWTWIRENPAAHAIDGGLKIEIEPGGLMGGGRDARNILVRPLPERARSASVRIEARHASQYEQAGLILYRGDDDYVKLVKEHVNGKSWIVLVVEIEARPRVVGKVPEPEGETWVGMEFGPKGIAARCWGTARRIVTVGEAGFPMRPRPRIGVFCQSGRAGADRWARFTHFAITSAPCTPRTTATLRPGTFAPYPIVTPGKDGGPPSDAIVLFDGKDLSRWRGRDGGPPGWKVADGVVTIVPGTGDMITRDAFGDIQLHLEWLVPEAGRGGNSGIKLHEAYEVQILDSYGRSGGDAKGQAGAVYKQHAPLVNACREPGRWQTFDIIFRAPRFGDDGRIAEHGRLTVLHNGVLVQDHVKIYGRTNSTRPVSDAYRQPFFLQDHGSAVRFRNLWVRELPPREDDGPAP